MTTSPERVRRTLTIVFADLVNSTPLAEGRDPESTHRLLGRYLETCADILEEHGGRVEKFIGDAVVAFFGLPELHEDDALRAVRAAVDVRQAIAELSVELERDAGVAIALKIAINTGEVFIAPGQRRDAFPSGDALNVAARLETNAEPGEILLGEQTYELVASRVHAEALDPLTVKGRTAPVHAWRLLELWSDEMAYAAPPATMFVDRLDERAILEGLLARATSAPGCVVGTIVGPPGIGKSRLAREFISSIGDDATVVVGRCLSYGRGITYRPLAEIVKQLTYGSPRELLAELVRDDEHAELVVERVLGAVGLGEPGGREETFWAVRRLVEAAARAKPLVAVLEDVHWAEPTFIDLIEYVADVASGAPIVLLCLSRPDLLESRPSWSAPQSGRTVLWLEPLPEPDARDLVDSLGADEATRARIIETADGNPLFLEELVALDDTATIPPTVQAVLAARIAALPQAERTVLEHASVEGRTFHRGAIVQLLPQQLGVDLGSHLMALVRKQLIQPDRAEFAGEEAFRFRHVLTRDAAYAALPKQDRADLHEALADWLEPKPGRPDEIVAYHLEQAYRFRTEIAAPGETERLLGARAAALLEAAGVAAASRFDLPAAIDLLTRAATLVPDLTPGRVTLLAELGAVLTESGALADAERVLSDAAAAAEELQDEQLDARVLVQQAVLQLQLTTDAIDTAKATVHQVLPVFVRSRDELGACRTRRLEAWLHWILGRTAAAEESWERAVEHARKAGSERDEAESLLWLCSAAVFGPMPVPSGIARCEQVRALLADHPLESALVLPPLAALEAMLGRFEAAAELLAEADATMASFGGLGPNSHLVAQVAVLAGDVEEAERVLRKDYDRLTRLGEKGFLSTTAALLASTVEAQGRSDEAEELTELAEQLAAEDDFSTQVVWRGVRSRVLAKRGQAADAERLAREAVACAAGTDCLNQHADALVDLAAVLRLLERPGEANVVDDALRLYEEKGNLVAASRIGARAHELQGGAPPSPPLGTRSAT